MALHAAEGDTSETRHFVREPAHTFTYEEREAGTRLLEIDPNNSFNPHWIDAMLTFAAPLEGHE
jgi:hypothetical protein